MKGLPLLVKGFKINFKTLLISEGPLVEGPRTAGVRADLRAFLVTHVGGCP